MTDKAKPERKPVDWEAIEREYRAGQLSVSEIGRQHGPTEGAIRKRAKKFGWQRDLSNRVREEIKARLVREDVPQQNQNDSNGNFESGTSSSEAGTNAARETSEAETVELAAARGVAVVRDHRKDIAEQRDLVRDLVAELKQESGTDGAEAREAIEKTINEVEKDARRRAAMLRAVSLPARAGVMRDLATAGKVLIELERQAFNLESGSPDGSEDGGAPIVNVYLPSNNRN